MVITAAAFCGSLAPAKAVSQHTQAGGKGRQSKTGGGSFFHVSCKLGMGILENILSNFSPSVFQLPFQKFKIQHRTHRVQQSNLSVQLTTAMESWASETESYMQALTCI